MNIRTNTANEDSNLPDWHEVIKEELELIERKLSDAVSSKVSTVSEVSMHLLLAGGKRLRPALVTLAAKAVGADYNKERITDIAAAAELVHMATLVHDDVIDDAESRRGKATAKVFWGNRISVLSGDCMLAKAFWFIAKETNERIMQTLAETTVRMSESEVMQAECEGSIEKWRQNYWQIINDKTAGFFSACCRCGAILAGADKETEQSLANYGTDLGLAFQITDDLLDVAGDPKITGKPAGSDIKDGKFTLPVLLALEQMPETQRKITQGLVERRNLTAQEVEAVCEAVRATEGINAARSYAKAYVEKAIASISELPSSDAKESLTAIARKIITRTS